jgi:hypothetical protein
VGWLFLARSLRRTSSPSRDVLAAEGAPPFSYRQTRPIVLARRGIARDGIALLRSATIPPTAAARQQISSCCVRDANKLRTIIIAVALVVDVVVVVVVVVGVGTPQLRRNSRRGCHAARSSERLFTLIAEQRLVLLLLPSLLPLLPWPIMLCETHRCFLQGRSCLRAAPFFLARFGIVRFGITFRCIRMYKFPRNDKHHEILRVFLYISLIHFYQLITPNYKIYTG